MANVRGVLQKGKNSPSYDPSTGKPYTPNVRLTPENGAKIVKAALNSGLSVNQIVNDLVSLMEVEPSGSPIFSRQYIQEAAVERTA